jgi:hypothetical protein
MYTNTTVNAIAIYAIQHLATIASINLSSFSDASRRPKAISSFHLQSLQNPSSAPSERHPQQQPVPQLQPFSSLPSSVSDLLS